MRHILSASIIATFVLNQSAISQNRGPAGQVEQTPSRTQTPAPTPTQTTTTTRTVRTTTWSTTSTTIDIGVFWQKSNEKKLAERGPVFSTLFNMSEFDIVAFAKGAWPAVLDYELAPGSVGFLMLNSDGVNPFYYRLSGPGRRMETLVLPQQFGPNPKISRYSIRVWQDQPGITTPALFAIYGIGAGPRAVGSVNIDQMRFAPAVVFAGQDKAEYSFRARKPFDRVAAEFVRVGLARAGGPIYAQKVGFKEHKNVRQEIPFRDSWDAKPGKEFKPLSKEDKAEGQFRLHVRAWLKSEKEGDWLAAWSDDIVDIRRSSGR